MALLLAMAVPSHAAPKGWESPKTERSDARTVARYSELEIKAARGTIIITTSHTLPIKIFTILGQLVNSETLSPGTSQYSVPAHGVYIIKAGDLTCKVAL